MIQEKNIFGNSGSKKKKKKTGKRPSGTPLLKKGENYGVKLKKIPRPSDNDLYFPEESSNPDLNFSDRYTTVNNSKWIEFHQNIQGEFYDETFSHNEKKSLLGLQNLKKAKHKKRLKLFKSMTWGRLSHYYPDLQVIFKNTNSWDIYQGKIGNCYFLSSLASLCEYPERVKRLLLQQKRSPKGAYCVSLCICGTFEEIVIDDMIPILKNKKTKKLEVAFCHNKKQGIWPILIEKAHAKAYGGYFNVGNGGKAREALFDLTGAPSICHNWEKFKTRGLKKIETIIEESDKNKFIICCSSRGVGQVENKMGITSGHAYTMIGFYNLSNGVKLLRLRNPWGKGGWKGDYSHGCKKWTKELKDEVKYKKKKGGYFYMKMEDFFKHFKEISICHYKAGYVLSSFPDVNKDSSLAVYEFNITKKGSYYFGLSQPDKCQFKLGHTYGFLSILVVKISKKGKVTRVGGNSRAHREVWFKAEGVSSGAYLAFVTTNWDNENTNELGLWVYGSKPAEIRRVIKRKNIMIARNVFFKAMMNFVS